MLRCRDPDGPEEPVAGERPNRVYDAVRRDAAHQAVARIGDIDRPATIHGHAARRVEACRGRGTIGVPGPDRAGDRDDRSVRLHRTNAIVVGVRDQDAAGGIHRHADRTVESRRCCGAVHVSGRDAAGDGRDNPFRRDPSDCVVAGVGDVKHSIAGEGDSRWCAEPRRCATAIRIPEPAAGKRGDGSVRTNAPDALRITCVGDIDAAVSRRGDPERI